MMCLLDALTTGKENLNLETLRDILLETLCDVSIFILFMFVCITIACPSIRRDTKVKFSFYDSNFIGLPFSALKFNSLKK